MLRRFGSEQGISYYLLSDEGSAAIRRLGLLNEHVEAQQAFYGRPVEERHAGIPYPGTFVLDGDGVVTRRLFEQSYRPRPGAGYLFTQAGGSPAPAPGPATSQRGPVKVAAWLDAERFRPLQVRELYVEVEVADGWHLYTDPIPDGYTPLRVRVEADSELDAWPARLPEGRPFEVAGLHERFHVVDGRTVVSVPFQLSGAGYALDGRPLAEPGTPGPVTIEAEVAYQACSETECLPPAAQRLRLEIEEVGLARPS